MKPTTSKYERIKLQLSPPIAHLTLVYPPVNVIDLQMMGELASAFSEVEALPMISMVILRGEGECFSAGVDIAAHTSSNIAEMLQKFHAVIRIIVRGTKIVLAVIDGNCLGGAAELAMACDIVITTESATWGFP
ncbi:MAG TPA: enoyl-CoA hydratase/isomerase family protein, partial [Terriglobales bacterium]|nr:enoyl-CoA hydratase/isomerase family protein [Terriglobales bacterium]